MRVHFILTDNVQASSKVACWGAWKFPSSPLYVPSVGATGCCWHPMRWFRPRVVVGVVKGKEMRGNGGKEPRTGTSYGNVIAGGVYSPFFVVRCSAARFLLNIYFLVFVLE